MPSNRRAFSTGTIILITVLIVLIALPWVLSQAFAPLRPIDLETTATIYVTIASDYQTVQAIKESSRTSVMIIDPTQTPDPAEVTPTKSAPIVTPSPQVVPSAIGTKSARSEPDSKLVAYSAYQSTTVAPATSPATQAATHPVGSNPTATIKLPKISTATPLPPVAKQIQLTNETASKDIQKTQKDIQDLKVTILADSIQITGNVIADGPLGTKISVGLEIVGTLSIENEKLRFKVTSVKVNGNDETNTERGKQAEGIVNDWLTGYLVRKKAQKLQQQPDLITLDILELSTSDLPTLRPTAAATVAVTQSGTRAVVGTVTVAPTVIAMVITPTATGTRRLTVATITVVPKTAAVTHIAVTIKTSAPPTATVATIIPSRTAVTVAAPANATSGPSPTVKLPQVTQEVHIYGSGTPQPTVVIDPNGPNKITGEQATLMTGGTLGPIKDVEITFDQGTVIVTGNVEIPANPVSKILGNPSVPIEIVGTLTTEDGKAKIEITSVKLAGKEVGNNNPIGKQAMAAVSDYVTDVLIPGKVSKISADEDTLVTEP